MSTNAQQNAEKNKYVKEIHFLHNNVPLSIVMTINIGYCAVVKYLKPANKRVNSCINYYMRDQICDVNGFCTGIDSTFHRNASLWVIRVTDITCTACISCLCFH